MNRPTRRTISVLSVVAALSCALAVQPVAPAYSAAVSVAAEKAIKKDDARKLIAAVSIFELNKEAVTIKEISPPAAVATVLASVKLGFRFVRDAAGAWRVADVRTGDRQWESFELLARALGSENISPARAELDALAAELDALARTKDKTTSDAPPQSQVANEAQSRSAKKAQNRSANKAQNPPAKELKRGAFSVKNPSAAFAPLGSSAVVELEVETSVDFVRDARGRWQVSRVRFGGGDARSFDAFATFESALNTEKLARARADLEILAAALEAYRRARGFYVVAETASALTDQLNPRFTAAFIRFDPWHRPYEYEGTRERFTLRSLGADGKANTPDDVTVGKG
jgi:Type II secretion system (T2SS), protein G